MEKLYQDSIAIIGRFGKPFLFITFTVKPKWEEIQQELLPNQTAADRPDLVARVFYLKVQDLLEQIRHKEVFGPWLGWVWTIEYQKQGLPHLHLLVFLKTDYQFLTAANIDQFISAEIPTEEDVIGQELSAIIQSTSARKISLHPMHPVLLKASGDRNEGRNSKNANLPKRVS